MKYILERRDNLIIFQIKNQKIEGEISSHFKAEFLIFCQPGLEAFIIDISDVDSIDSAGFGALLLAYRQLKEFDIPVVITGTNEYIRSMMSITQIESLFEFYETLPEALADYDPSLAPNEE